MNTKGVKFLAVLAVMALAFAAFAALTPTENDDAVKVYNNSTIDRDITVYTTSGVSNHEFYVSEDATVKIKEAADAGLTFYVQNGKTLELDIKANQTQTITVVTVTGDQERQTTSHDVVHDGKLVLNSDVVIDDVACDTSFTFVGVAGQSFYYKAATGSYSVSYADGIFTGKWTLKTNAMVGADKEFTTAPTSGNKVSVAQGQMIAVKNASPEIANLDYGVFWKDTSVTPSVGTYYAPGNNAGSISFNGSSDTVSIMDGTATISYGNSVVKAASIYGAPVTISADSAGLSIGGTLYAGDINASGAVKFASGYTNEGGTVTIANKATVAAGSAIINNSGSVVVKAGKEIQDKLTVTGDGTVVLQNPKLWDDVAVTSFIINVDGVDGLVDTSAINEVGEIRKNFIENTIPVRQTYTVVEDAKILQSLTMKGILIVNDGVTLTVDEGACIVTEGKYSQIINNGKIVVKAKGASNEGIFVGGGVFVNNGTIEFSAKANEDREDNPTFSIANQAISFVNNGTITISKNDVASFASLINNGTLNLNGKAGTTTITNYGKITVNGAEINGTVTTKLATKGATVTVSSMKMTTSGQFTVDDKLMMNTKLAAGKSDVTITTEGVDGITVRSITYTATTDGINKTPFIDLRGSMGVTIPNTEADPEDTFATFTMTKDVMVSNSLVIPKNMKLGLSASGVTLKVPGTMSIDKAVGLATGSDVTKLTMTVTGKVIDGGSILDNCKYVAAKYVSSDATIYTTLNNAIAEALAADVLSVEIGPITITEDVTIPADMSVVADADWVTEAAQVKVGDSKTSPTITVESTGRLSGLITIVSGAIYAEDAGDVSVDEVTAHVVTEGAFVADDILLESLDVAISHATAEDIIELASEYVLDGGSLVIPAGVIVDATINSTDFVLINSDLTVDGMLITDGFEFFATTDDTKEITVGGYMKNPIESRYSPHWFTPIGVSYFETTDDPYGLGTHDADEVQYFVITTIDNLQPAINVADDKKVTVEGKAKLGNISISGNQAEPTDVPAEVTFKEDISAGTITMENAIIIAEPGKQISATFADELGSITITGAYVADGTKDVKIYSLGQDGVYMSGPVNDKTNGTYSIWFEGKTGTNNATIAWGKAVDPVVYPTITFAGETLATGKTVIANLDNDEDDTEAGVVSILGSLTADNGARIIIAADVDVLGSLNAAESDGSSTNGTVDVNGNIFLGTTKDAVFDEKALILAENGGDFAYAYYGYGYNSGVAATAALTGKITVYEYGFITAMPGTSIEDSIIEDMESMDVIIEGKVWFTVYGYGSFSLDGLTPDIKDCSVDKIYDIDGVEIADYSQTYKVIYNSDILNLGTTDAIFIDLDYNIFTVLVKTDASIKAVYVDGILTYTGDDENQFYSYRVAAGTHVVTVEPTSGYKADKAYLYEEDGTKLSGMKFTFDENDCVPGSHMVIYNVAGTEKIVDVVPEPEQVSEWTITTILLLVLVVLIAIMAVIVALRLNRS